MAECPRGAFFACAGEAGPVAVYPVITGPVNAQTFFVTSRSIFVGVRAELTLGTLEAILADARSIATEAVCALSVSGARPGEASWTLVAARPVEAFAALWCLHSGVAVPGTATLQGPCSASVDTVVCEECCGLRVGRTFAPMYQGTANTSAQFQFSLCFIASVGQNWDDGGRNQNSSQRVNLAIFGSDLKFFHCHVICQNLPIIGYVKLYDLVGHAPNVKGRNEGGHFKLGKGDNVVSDEFQKLLRSLWREEVIKSAILHVIQCFITWNKNGVWFTSSIPIIGTPHVGFL